MRIILTFVSMLCQGFVRSGADLKPLASEDGVIDTGIYLLCILCEINCSLLHFLSLSFLFLNTVKNVMVNHAYVSSRFEL